MQDAIWKFAEPKTRAESIALVDVILTDIDQIDSRMDSRARNRQEQLMQIEQLKRREEQLDKQFSEHAERVRQKLNR